MTANDMTENRKKDHGEEKWFRGRWDLEAKYGNLQQKIVNENGKGQIRRRNT